MNKAKLGMFLGPGLFILCMLVVPAAEMGAPARAILAATLWIATWWITEAIPIPATSLLPIILFPLTGGLDIKATTSPYGSPMIFLFVGGFIIAIAIEKWNLHRRIALNIINLVGTKSQMLILGFMLATAFLSMWISNTATTMMMMPIGIAIVTQLASMEHADDAEAEKYGKILMLAIDYAASIGGIATLIGTPTNVVFSGVVKQIYGVEISFAQWFSFGLPVSLILLTLGWLYLTRFVARRFGVQELSSGAQEIARELRALGPITYEEKWVLAVFSATAISWISRTFVLNRLLPGIDDTVIAIGFAVFLFIIPGRAGAARRLMNWSDAHKLPWGIILLFGGGLSLAAGFRESGLATWIGAQLGLLQDVSLYLVLLVIILLVNFLTEITSNVATASMILPVLAALASAMAIHPFGVMISATMAASCAFMLPVATPPNAVVFGSGYLEIYDMARAGLLMNLMSSIVLSLLIYYLLPVFWGIDLGVIPEMFNQ
jgi:sodium-dependent dicarboxylate transporter 2/3/5